MADQNMAKIRIPRVLLEELEHVINQVPVQEANGTFRRMHEPFGLTNSNTALINTALLALLSVGISADRLSLLTQMTPGVNEAYVNETKRRLLPEQAVSISASSIIDLENKQDERFHALVDELEKMYLNQEQFGGGE